MNSQWKLGDTGSGRLEGLVNDCIRASGGHYKFEKSIHVVGFFRFFPFGNLGRVEAVAAKSTDRVGRARTLARLRALGVGEVSLLVVRTHRYIGRI